MSALPEIVKQIGIWGVTVFFGCTIALDCVRRFRPDLPVRGVLASICNEMRPFRWLLLVMEVLPDYLTGAANAGTYLSTAVTLITCAYTGDDDDDDDRWKRRRRKVASIVRESGGRLVVEPATAGAR